MTGPRRLPWRPLALALLALALWFLCSPPSAPRPEPGSALGLSRYAAVGIFPLPVREASAVAYRPDHDSLLVLGDHADSIIEVDRSGQLIGRMELRNFQDTEGLTHRGGTRLLLAEEGNQQVFEIEYVAGSRLDRSSLTGWRVGPTGGNEGLEGISFDAATGVLFGVKERSPREIFEIELLAPPTVQVREAFDATRLHVGDLAGVQVLSSVARLTGTPAAENLLLLSQESSRLLEVDRAGNTLDSLSLRFFSRKAEGVAIDPAGTVFVVAESSRATDGSALLVLVPPPDASPRRS